MVAEKHDHRQLDAFIPLDADLDVHTEHCCGEHLRCKYGKEETECTVARKLKLPSYPCNCDWI